MSKKRPPYPPEFRERMVELVRADRSPERFHQLVNKACRCGEPNRHAPLTSTKAESQRDMALAGTAWSECDNVLPAQNILATGKLQDEHFVERWDRHEIEAVEALHRGEARRPDAPFHHPPLTLDELQLGKPERVARMIDTVPGTFAGEFVVFGGPNLADSGWKL